MYVLWTINIIALPHLSRCLLFTLWRAYLPDVRAHSGHSARTDVVTAARALAGGGRAVTDRQFGRSQRGDGASAKGGSVVMDDLYCEIGRRIKAEREELGFAQQELAHEVQLTRTSIANIEAGRQRLPIHVLYAVANALGISVSCLLPSNL